MNRGERGQHFKQHFIETQSEGGREREGEGVDQKAEKTTSINTEPRARTKSQLKQRQMGVFHLRSGPSHLLPPLRRGSREQKRGGTGDEGRTGVDRRAARVTDGCRSASSAPQRDGGTRAAPGLEDEAPDRRRVASGRGDALGERGRRDGSRAGGRSLYAPAKGTRVRTHRGELLHLNLSRG